MTFTSGLIRYVAGASLLTLALHAHADCTLPVRNDQVPGYADCKDWPAYPGQTITVLSQREADSTAKDPYSAGIFDLALAVVPSQGGAPLASYARASLFISDAFSFNGLSIDTARYQLTPQLRAFGVRAVFSNASQTNPFGETWLSLYVKEGKTLRPVLESLIVESDQAEWGTRCEGEYHETRRTLEMARTRSHGYADLVIRTVSKDTTHVSHGEDCVSTSSTRKPVLTTLRYDGRQYVVPLDMKGQP